MNKSLRFRIILCFLTQILSCETEKKNISEKQQIELTEKIDNETKVKNMNPCRRSQNHRLSLVFNE